MRSAAWVLAILLLLPLPLAAQSQPDAGEAPSSVETTDGQKATPADIFASFTRLVDRGETRRMFGLPQEHFWRRSEPMEVALFADNAPALVPMLEGAVAPFAAVSGLHIEVVESGPAEIAGKEASALAPEAELVIVVAPRPRLAELAFAGGFNMGMLANFEMGRLPFMFTFEQDQLHRGVVLLADDEPARAREASFILATVWALGGVTLGPELTGLVTDNQEGPALTPLGEAVFRLFFHDDLEVGMPLKDAVQRAETLLPQ